MSPAQVVHNEPWNQWIDWDLSAGSTPALSSFNAFDYCNFPGDEGSHGRNSSYPTSDTSREGPFVFNGYDSDDDEELRRRLLMDLTATHGDIFSIQDGPHIISADFLPDLVNSVTAETSPSEYAGEEFVSTDERDTAIGPTVAQQDLHVAHSSSLTSQNDTSPKRTGKRRSKSHPHSNALCHTIIEARYRTKLKDNLAELKRVVPTLRVKLAMEEGATDGMNDDGSFGGLEPARNLKKTTVLAKTLEYIRYLEERNGALAMQIAQRVDCQSTVILKWLRSKIH